MRIAGVESGSAVEFLAKPFEQSSELLESVHAGWRVTPTEACTRRNRRSAVRDFESDSGMAIPQSSQGGRFRGS